MPLTLVYPRTTTLRVSLGGETLPAISYQATAGFDRRYIEATVDLPFIPSNPQSRYYQDVNIVAGAGQQITRFAGMLVDYGGEIYPNVHRLICKGKLWAGSKTFNPNVLEPAIGGTAPGQFAMNLAAYSIINPVSGTTSTAYGRTDQDMVMTLLNYIPRLTYQPGRIGGTGRILGALIVPRKDTILQDTGPFSWGSNTTNLQMIEQIDEISVLSETGAGGGAYFGRAFRTYQTPNGEVNRAPIGGRPRNTLDYTFTEGVDIERGSYGRMTSQLINASVVLGYDMGTRAGPMATIARSSNPFQTGWVPGNFQSAMLEQEDEALAESSGFGISTYAYSQYMLLQDNRELKRFTFVTPLDNYYAPGQTIGILAPNRAGTTEPYWIMNAKTAINRGGMWWTELDCLGGGTPDAVNDAPPGADPGSYGGISSG